MGDEEQVPQAQGAVGFAVPVPKFSGKKTDFLTFSERFTSCMEANQITDEIRKTHIFISSMGDELYKLAHDLYAPDKVADQTFDDIVKKLKDHMNPPPNIITARCTFNRYYQRTDDTINTYVATLKKLSEDCQYGEHLNTWLRDRFVAGLYNEAIRRRLLQESDALTFAKAHQLALAYETASREAKALQSNSGAQKYAQPNVNKVSHWKSKPQQGKQGSQSSQKQTQQRGQASKDRSLPCIRCKSMAHKPRDCPYINTVCNDCSKVGHLAHACLSKERQNKGQPHKNQKVRMVNDNSYSCEDEFEDDYDTMYSIWSGPQEKSKMTKLKLVVNQKPLTFEVDTGSAVTLMNEQTFHKTFPSDVIVNSNKRLRSYGGEPIPVLGQCSVNVSMGGEEKARELTLIVVDGKGPALVGRDWLQHLEPWKDTLGKTLEINQLMSDSADVSEIVTSLQEKYPGVFQEGLGHLKDVKAKLDVKDDAKPVFCKARPVPLALRDKVEKEIDRLEADGIIEKVKYSDWAAPVVPVVKPNGEVRLCGDYKMTVNKVANTETYPIPKREELFAGLNGGQEFTKLDLRHAYQQIELDEESRRLTTINTTKGLYQYTRLPYGVSTAPALFQRIMETILKGIPGTLVYMDDILVTGNDRPNHIGNLEQVLKRLDENGFRLQKDKCQFFLPRVDFLGDTVDQDGVRPTTEKVRAVHDAPAPKNISELRAYLGLVNHYGKYLSDLATTLVPLYKLLKKNVPWQWNSEQSEAFSKSKQALTSDKLLVHYDPDKELLLSCDASPYGLGIVLQHRIEGHDRPIAYASRRLTSAEENYSQIEKEGLAIIFGVSKFRQYLLGRRFTLVTDHRPLLSLFSPSKGIPQMAASRIKRWALILSTFTYDIQFRSSKNNANADGLSRLPLAEVTSQSCPRDEELVLTMKTFEEDMPITAQDVARETKRDTVLQKVVVFIMEGWPEEIDTVADIEIKPYFNRRTELSVEQGCVLWGTRVIVPRSLRPVLLKELHSEHSGIVRMKAVARSIIWWPLMDSEIEEVAKACSDCQEVSALPPSSKPTTWKWPAAPWKRLHVDYAGPIYDQYYFIVVDAHSKWLEVIPMKNITTAATIKHLRRMFATFGIPEHIVSDNGSQFTSEEFQVFLKTNNIRHTLTAPGHPATNGQAERFVQSFKVAMKKMTHQPGSLDDKLQRFLLSYRTTPHATTGKPPCELLMNRSLRTRLTAIRPSRDSLVTPKDDSVDDGKFRYFTVGQPVFVLNFGTRGARWVAGVILERHGARNYHVSVGEYVWKRHVDQLRPRKAEGHPVESEAVVELPMVLGELPMIDIPSVPMVPSSTSPVREMVNSETRETSQRSVPVPKSPIPVVRRNPVRERRAPMRYRDT